MLKKSFALGVLAAMAMAPAAFADQIQGNVSNTQISTGNAGVGNVNGVVSNTDSLQNQSKFGSPWCASGNQIQGNVAGTAIAAANAGIANNSGVVATTGNSQSQSAGCSPYYYGY